MRALVETVDERADDTAACSRHQRRKKYGKAGALPTETWCTKKPTCTMIASISGAAMVQ